MVQGRGVRLGEDAEGELAPSPLDLSESFAKKHEDRIKQLEREIARNAPRSDERENAEASEIFKNF